MSGNVATACLMMLAIACALPAGSGCSSDSGASGVVDDTGTSGGGGETPAEGAACTITNGFNCDPACQSACGDPACVDACCHEVPSTPGVVCGGKCVKAGTVKCGDECTDLSNNASHCGTCENACASTKFCKLGVCVDRSGGGGDAGKTDTGKSDASDGGGGGGSGGGG